ncbi:MAG: hypothetical protein ORN98_10615 [Alphaproteobacteria bacterium]|nr:hypothetical protein [Alphaproteobacteria bacterium]
MTTFWPIGRLWLFCLAIFAVSMTRMGVMAAQSQYFRMGAGVENSENHDVAVALAEIIGHKASGAKTQTPLIALIVADDAPATRLAKLQNRQLDAVILSSAEIYSLKNSATRAASQVNENKQVLTAPPLFGLRSLAALEFIPIHVIVNATAKHRLTRSEDLRGRRFLIIGRNPAEAQFLEQIFAPYRPIKGGAANNLPNPPKIKFSALGSSGGQNSSARQSDRPTENRDKLADGVGGEGTGKSAAGDQLDPSFGISAEQLRSIEKLSNLAEREGGELRANRGAIMGAIMGAENGDSRKKMLESAFADLAAEQWDAVILMARDPIPELAAAAQKYPLNMLNFLQLPSKQNALINAVTATRIDKKFYNGMGEVDTLAVTLELCVTSRMKFATAYEVMTKLWAQDNTPPTITGNDVQKSTPILPRSKARIGLTLPLHPAAARYYSDWQG